MTENISPFYCYAAICAIAVACTGCAYPARAINNDPASIHIHSLDHSMTHVCLISALCESPGADLSVTLGANSSSILSANGKLMADDDILKAIDDATGQREEFVIEIEAWETEKEMTLADVVLSANRIDEIFQRSSKKGRILNIIVASWILRCNS